MSTQRKTARVTFLEYLMRRAQKRGHVVETDDSGKKANLLAHRFVVMDTIGNALQNLAVPHAIIGGHAVTFHGRPRMTDDIDVLVLPHDVQAAAKQLHLQQVSPLRTGGCSGVTPEGLRIDLVSPPNQSWIEAAISQAVTTPHGPMIDAPYLVISKLWDSRGAQDETDVLGVLKRMTDADLDVTRRLVAQYLPNDADDLETLILLRSY